MIRRLPLIPTIIVAAAVLTMIGLGVWQLRRAAWKDALLARYEAAQSLPPIAFPTAPIGEELPLFRRASGLCLQPVTARAHRRPEPQGRDRLFASSSIAAPAPKGRA